MSGYSWADALNTIMAGDDLARAEAEAAMTQIMDGEATDAQIAAFIVALRTKGESADEMAGMVDAMMKAAVTVDLDDVVDIVGTGGDGYGTFNISTTAAFIATGAGVKVAKHGNRAASSKTGSADLLEALGYDLDLGPAKAGGGLQAGEHPRVLRHVVGRPAEEHPRPVEELAVVGRSDHNARARRAGVASGATIDVHG